jgi:chromosome segregation ATPase
VNPSVFFTPHKPQKKGRSLNPTRLPALSLPHIFVSDTRNLNTTSFRFPDVPPSNTAKIDSIQSSVLDQFIATNVQQASNNQNQQPNNVAAQLVQAAVPKMSMPVSPAAQQLQLQQQQQQQQQQQTQQQAVQQVVQQVQQQHQQAQQQQQMASPQQQQQQIPQQQLQQTVQQAVQQQVPQQQLQQQLQQQAPQQVQQIQQVQQQMASPQQQQQQVQQPQQQPQQQQQVQQQVQQPMGVAGPSNQNVAMTANNKDEHLTCQWQGCSEKFDTAEDLYVSCSQVFFFFFFFRVPR